MKCQYKQKCVDTVDVKEKRNEVSKRTTQNDHNERVKGHIQLMIKSHQLAILKQ